MLLKNDAQVSSDRGALSMKPEVWLDWIFTVAGSRDSAVVGNSPNHSLCR
jgi:hypothetical protein